MKAALAPLILLAVCAAPAVDQTSATHDVCGTWVDGSNSAVKWTLSESGGKMHVQETNGSKEVDYTCTLSGKECSVKEDGRSETVMLYFNGTKLVEIKERGNEVLKRQLSVSSDGKAMQVETVPLSAEQKPETHTFQRQQLADSNSKS